MAFLRRSSHDREIGRLAIPAFGALAAEPLYLLVDTAIVGHLGTRQLGGLAIAGIVLTAVFGLCNFLAYSTTGAVARRIGSGDVRRATAIGVDGMWLAGGLGLALALIGIVAAPAIVDVMGASNSVRPFALSYLRISLIGAPAVLLALAGAGYQRGRQDTKSTLLIALGANLANLGIELVAVYGLGLGIEGSAWSTVVAQYGAAAAYLALVLVSARRTRASLRPDAAGIRSTARIGSQVMVRTAALLIALLTTTALAARVSTNAVAAHQVAFQIWAFLALSLDAIAIAAQAMIGRFLGAEDAEEAHRSARRMIEWSVLVGVALGAALALSRTWLVPLFTDDPQVRELASQLLLIVAAMQPLNAVVFVLDGILLGAGDSAYLAVAMVAALGAFAIAAVVVVVLDGGLFAIWGALCVLMVARLIGMGARFLRGGWQVTGAVRASRARS
ncbi:MAG TPA: MATE family efflux transporter [Acidimicrobiia bacterium]|nr:MATE family efflux transporter [Acidimicrobiia bacterium]